MQVVATVIRWQQAGGVSRIAQEPVEVDHAVEIATTPHPGVDRLPHGFFFGGVIGRRDLRALERRDRSCDDPYAAAVRARDELSVTIDQISGRHGVGGWRDSSREPEVIYAEGHDHDCDARLRQRIPIETFEAGLAESIANLSSRTVSQQPISDDSLV